MVSLLRKKRHLPDTTPSSSQHRPSRELSHSLSLPDLTTPLLDPSSWEEIPDFLSSIPSLPNSRSAGHIGGAKALFSPTSSTFTRNRSPSLVAGSPGSPVAFHKPFGTWQVVNPPNEPPVPALVYRGDFRKSTWLGKEDFRGSNGAQGDGRVGRESAYVSHVGAGGTRRRKKGRVAESLNVMLVGGKGVGKTSLLNLLRDTSSSSDLNPPQTPALLSPARHIQTPSSPTSPGPPVTPGSAKHSSSSSVSSSPTSPSSHLPSSSTPLQRPAPTTRLTSSTITLDRAAEKIQLCLIDTPGLDLRGDDGPALHARQRERGVQALLSVAEERFGEVLREESKVVRRQLSGGSGLIHLCIYLIDARAVLHPAEEELEVDWSGLSLSDTAKPTAEAEMQDLTPNLAKVEIDVVSPRQIVANGQIKRLGERMNVLPVLTHADCLSSAELAAVRSAVRRDLREALGDVDGRGFGFFRGVSPDADETAGRKTPVVRVSSSDENTSPGPEPHHQDSRPPTPASTIRASPTLGEDEDSNMPYAVFAPSTVENGTREFPWGVADVSKVLDLNNLREAILDTHAKALRTTTREVLYERYRTERLLARRGKRGLENDEVISEE